MEAPTVYRQQIQPGAGWPVPSAPAQGRGRLEVAVIFTSESATMAALRHAGAMAAELAAHIRLLVPQVVPYPLPLTSPPILVDWNERRYQQIAGVSPVETLVEIRLCRDANDAILSALEEHSLVVIGCRRSSWRFARERRVARRLRRDGHQVVVIETE